MNKSDSHHLPTCITLSDCGYLMAYATRLAAGLDVQVFDESRIDTLLASDEDVANWFDTFLSSVCQPTPFDDYDAWDVPAPEISYVRL